MSERTLTGYQIKNEQLLLQNKPTQIRVEDDYFFLKDKALNLYIEDGQIFLLQPLLPFLKWPMISSTTGITVDSGGFLWSKDKTCIFDQYLHPTYSL